MLVTVAMPVADSNVQVRTKRGQGDFGGSLAGRRPGPAAGGQVRVAGQWFDSDQCQWQWHPLAGWPPLVARPGPGGLQRWGDSDSNPTRRRIKPGPALAALSSLNAADKRGHARAPPADSGLL